MTARDELVGIISQSFYNEHQDPTTHTADAILAAGYRKPRTITTAAELETLPIGSVVLSEGYTHHANQMPISFQRWTDGEWHRGARAGMTHPDNFLPVTVLHEGAES